MVIEINKDIDAYQESVALGLTAKQLIFSLASVTVGTVIILLLYKPVGITGAAYIAIPCVAPIALGGFYSYQGMDFYEYMGKRIRYMFNNPTYLYISTENEAEFCTDGQNKDLKQFKSNSANEKCTETDNSSEFELMKKKMKRVLLATLIGVVLVVAALVVYKLKQKGVI